MRTLLGATSPSGLLTLRLASIAMLPNVGPIANANTLIQLRQAPKLYRISLLDGACLTVRAIAKLFISRTVPIRCFVLYFMMSFLMFTRITCPSDLCGIASFSLSRKRLYRVCSCQTDYFVDRVLVPETAIKKNNANVPSEPQNPVTLAASFLVQNPDSPKVVDM
jgi:hypothetical protein